MNVRLVTLLVVGLFTVSLIGCRTAPIYNVDDTLVATNKADFTKEDVRKAIIRAGGGLGWQMNDAGPNNMEGTLHLRTHMAKVNIPYSKDSYSIVYEDSTNLNYDGTIIHRNYNGWIQNLDKAIQVQLNTL